MRTYMPDDCKLSISQRRGKSFSAMHLQSDLDAHSQWAKLMQPTVPAPKCKILTTDKMRPHSPSNLRIQAEIIITEIKDAGITVDDKLNFDSVAYRKLSKLPQSLTLFSEISKQ